MSYLEQRAILAILPPVRRGSVGERTAARRSCARAHVRGILTLPDLAEVLEMLGLEEGA